MRLPEASVGNGPTPSGRRASDGPEDRKEAGAPAAGPSGLPDPGEIPLAGRLRFVTAAALFDGHDASIHVFRRLLERRGVEVIHIGHNRSAAEIASAAIQEDAHAVAVSSYQGGHNEFFRYLVDLLRDGGGGRVLVFGGGGGVIRAGEAAALHEYGVERIYSPEDGRRLGLLGMIEDMVRRADRARPRRDGPETPDSAGTGRTNGRGPSAAPGSVGDPVASDASDGPAEPGPRVAVAGRADVARFITRAEEGRLDAAERKSLEALVGSRRVPVLGITGTGGAGKSSVLDELLLRLASDHARLPVAVLAVDPSKRRTGGALLGDRIRLNAARNPSLFVRSIATRGSGNELADVVRDALLVCRAAGFGLVVVETGGIGQGASRIVDVSDLSLYVMTSDYGAESQLEKIDMLDFADFVALNKADHPGAEDAVFQVKRALRRLRGLPRDAETPVWPTIASRFADPGLDALYLAVLARLRALGDFASESKFAAAADPTAPEARPPTGLLPARRRGYLSEITTALREEAARVDLEVGRAARLEHLEEAANELERSGASEAVVAEVRERRDAARAELDPENLARLEEWPAIARRFRADVFEWKVRGRRRETATHRQTLSGLSLPRVAAPRFVGRADLLRFLLDENLPGRYPFTGGVFPFKREEESPRRQFAGEGGPSRTNRRFRALVEGDDAVRLSTAFDSVTLYGEDPARRPDIFGKIGEGGVSIATIDDMKDLFEGFRLTDPTTSVSMTINGPAPAILAMFLNAAIDQEKAAFESARGTAPGEAEAKEIERRTLAEVRGTVQADILKEDQAQNTCIFSTEFGLRLMGDVQEFFTEHGVRNFYSASISGYHIAEAGANPVTQLAFTLANGFTYVECFLARGLDIDDFAPNLSFFFSNGLDPEYAVLGRVARRIWARALKLCYGAKSRSQRFKYHIQTSGRSLHAEDVQFNDIRTTLQALTATYDHCNSLHSNAYDEAITTPTPESVRRAVAIQKIIRLEFGMTGNENPLQGSFVISELTDLVEEAVLAEFDRLDARGGVLAAMERQYQRNRIQEESLLYETRKDAGEIPIVGVNVFRADDDGDGSDGVRLARAAIEEKEEQVRRVERFREKHAGKSGPALARLQETARVGGNVFAELMRAVRVASLGQITHALYEVGGRYRRST